MNDPSFFLQGIVKDKEEMRDFEGPLSLILMLLSKNKIEIRDIQIADIVDQYINYLNKMQSMDLEIASEFIQMASHLIYIKTRTLLSGDEEVSELEALMESLEQLKCKEVYQAIQKLTPELKKAADMGMLYFAKLPEPLDVGSEVYSYKHEPAELLLALYSVFSRGGSAPDMSALDESIPKKIAFSVKNKSRQLLEKLRNGKCTLIALYGECSSKSEIVATFLSILELCSMGNVMISRQEEDYVLSFVGGDLDEIIEKIVE